jgi:hypothetical protein
MADKTNIVAVKSTVFGLDISSNGEVPHIRLGLVRHFYQQIPTSTNAVFSPVYTSHTDAVIGATRQTVIEDFTIGK